MLFWMIMIAFGLPLIYLLIEIASEKSNHKKKLEALRSRLKEIERRKANKEGHDE